MPKWNMSRSHGETDSKSEDTDESADVRKKGKSAFRANRFKTKFKCGHTGDLPVYVSGFNDFCQEGADEFAQGLDCYDCRSKKVDAENQEHYAWMKAYNDRKRTAKIAEAKREAAEAKIKKTEAARAKRFAAENRKANNKKKTTGKKGRSAGFKTDD